MKILMHSGLGIGDFFSSEVPVMKAFHEQGHEISVLTWKHKAVANLAMSMPFISSVLSLEDAHSIKDLQSEMKQFDAIIVRVYYNRPPDPKILLLLAQHGLQLIVPNYDQNFSGLNRTDRVLRSFGFVYKPRCQNVAIHWYSEFYRDFNCKENSLLLHCTASSIDRSYMRAIELKEVFEAQGFDVRLIDDKSDIRENLFLIDQIQNIVTVDTSVLWIAKALGKRPLCFQDKFTAVTFGLPRPRLLLAESLNSLTPQEIFAWAYPMLSDRLGQSRTHDLQSTKQQDLGEDSHLLSYEGGSQGAVLQL